MEQGCDGRDGGSLHGDRDETQVDEADIDVSHDGWPYKSRHEGTGTRKHVVLAAATGLVVLVVLAIVLPVCLTGSRCGRRAPASNTTTRGAAIETALRLIVAPKLASMDTRDALPAQLRQFASRVKLPTSALQVLSMVDEPLLLEAERILKQHADIALVLRDFKMAREAPPGGARQQPPPPPVQQQQQQRGRRRKQRQQPAAAPGRRLQQQPAQEIPSHLKQIGADSAWKVTKGQSSLVVAVLDTGVDTSHPDLAGSLWVNSKEIPGNGIDDDRNGYIDDVNGYSFLGACTGGLDTWGGCMECGPTSDVKDADGHGTHVAGIIAAASDAKLGIAGVAPQVRVMVLKVSDCSTGAIYATSVFRALDYAMRMGAQLVSCSFGRAYPDGFSPTDYAPPWDDHQTQTAAYARALAPLSAAGVLLFAAAGNNAVNLDALASLGYSDSPCLGGMTLDGVICVGAATENGTLADYSNFGARAVALAAPGSVRSTWPGGAAKDLWGTSMATPVATGTAALVFSVLSSLTGNATGLGPAVKQLLLGAGGAPSSGPAAGYARRLDAAAAVRAALARFAPAGMPVVSPLAWPAAGGAPLVHATFAEQYYATTAARGWRSSDAAALTTARAAAVPLGGFRFSRGYTVRFSANAWLSSPGIYSIRVTWPTAQLSVCGAPAPARAGAGGRTFHFQARAPGWHAFDFAIPEPSGSIDVQIRAPGDGDYSRMTGFVTAAPAAAAATVPAPPAPGFVTTRSLWSFYFNATQSAAALTPGAVASLGGTAPGGLPAFRSSATSRGLAFAPSALRAFLLPGAAANAGAVGTALGGVEAKQANPLYVFKVTCKGCTLSVGGQLLVDAWQSAATPGGASKQSGCVTFQRAGIHAVQVNFGGSSMADAPLQLHWARCNDASNWSPVAAASSAAWAPSEGLTGWVGGMQCDVWRGAAPAAGDGPAPVYKVRLPAAVGAVNPVDGPLTGSFPRSLEDMLPGLAATSPPSGPQRFSLRCWAFTAASLGQVTMEPKAVTSAHLGHAQVWAGAGPATPPPAWQQPPDGQAFRPLVLVWRGVSATQQLSVAVGGAPLALSAATMRLPIPVLASKDAKVMGAPGHFSQAFVPQSPGVPDVMGLISYDTSALKAQGSTSSDTSGLGASVAASYGGVTGGALRYAAAAGYAASPVTGAAPAAVRLSWTNPPGQGVLLVAGGAPGVTLRNGAGFGARAAAGAGAESFSVDLYLPPGYLRLSAVSKSKAPGAGAVFSGALASPAGAEAVPMGPKIWSRAVDPGPAGGGGRR